MDKHKNFYNPYSFVPLSNEALTFSKKEIKKYDYAHDMPITEDSVSGQIEIEMQAETPFCIKTESGHSINIDGQYFIPGTTIKGMIRNVFEIITFSNIKRLISDSRYSMRDLRNNDYELNKNIDDRRGGFLINLKNEYYIIDSYFDKYSYEEIEDIEDVNIKGERTIRGKYNKLKEGHVFRAEGHYYMWMFSGHMFNKKHEFLFEIPQSISSEQKYQIKDQEWKDFIFIHEKENENDAWKFWKKKLRNYSSMEEIIKDNYKGIVPCFYRLKKSDNEQIVKDFGFSFLYRQPYTKSIHDFVPKAYHTEDFDMTDLVFGYTRPNNSLKGRVSFSNAFISNMKVGEVQTFIMGKPKPTYYPFYLEQDKHGKLKTYFSDDTVISGWKRNLVHHEAKQGKSTGKPRVESSFIPIKEGATIKSIIRFHNLSKPELGALLSALTFHDYKEGNHLLGYAKAFGYGKFKISDVTLKPQSYNEASDNINNYMRDFEDFLKSKSINMDNWQYILDKLRLFASGKYTENRDIRYPDLNSKEFEKIKNKELRLNDYTPK